jgi:hypothetical protein
LVTSHRRERPRARRRRPLTKQLAQAVELHADDRSSLLNVLDALLTKTRVKNVISGQAA